MAVGIVFFWKGRVNCWPVHYSRKRHEILCMNARAAQLLLKRPLWKINMGHPCRFFSILKLLCGRQVEKTIWLSSSCVLRSGLAPFLDAAAHNAMMQFNCFSLTPCRIYIVFYSAHKWRWFHCCFYCVHHDAHFSLAFIYVGVLFCAAKSPAEALAFYSFTYY